MIDSIAMILCIGGFGALSLSFRRIGFALSLAGSLAWLLFALGVNSTPLLLQSIAFLVFSGVGLVGKDERAR
jgi:hypothetical protein